MSLVELLEDFLFQHSWEEKLEHLLTSVRATIPFLYPFPLSDQLPCRLWKSCPLLVSRGFLPSPEGKKRAYYRVLLLQLDELVSGQMG